MRPTTFPNNARGARIPRGSISVMTFHDRCAPARDDHGTSSRAKERAGPARAKKLRRESRHGLVCRVSKHAGPLTSPLLGGAEGLPETLRAPLEAVMRDCPSIYRSKSVSCAIVPVFTGRKRFFRFKKRKCVFPTPARRPNPSAPKTNSATTRPNGQPAICDSVFMPVLKIKILLKENSEKTEWAAKASFSAFLRCG